MYQNLLQDPAVLGLLNGGKRLDSACGEKKETDDRMVADSASAYAMQDITMRAVASVQQWCETPASDLEDGEGMADRLFAMMVGIADDNKDGELDEAETAVVQMAMNAAWDYMVSKGVSEDDLDALFDTEDPEAANAAAMRVCEFMAEKLPDGDDASADEMDDWAFTSDQGSVFDAVYKKRMAVRGGKKVRIMKRVSGTVRLTGKQRLAIRKAGMKARSAGAMFKRMKSMRVRKSMGMR